MNMNLFIIRSPALGRQAFKNIAKCCYATTSNSTSIVSELEVEEVPVYEVDTKYDDEYLEKIRNKSRLSPADRNVLHGEKPYNESYAKFHDTVKYRKKLLGRYGIEAMGVSPAIAWPTKADIENVKEYEHLAYPKTIHEIWKDIEERKKLEAEEKRTREEEIDKAVANFDKWRAALDAKIAKKEADLLEAKQRKERTMQEIREQFGFNIDPRDERVKELLAQKEKEDKKKRKEAKKKKKEEKLLAYLSQKEQEQQEKPDPTQSEKDSVDEKDVELKSSEISDDKKEIKKPDH